MTKKKVLLSGIAALVLGLTGCQSADYINVKQNDQVIAIAKSPEKIVVMDFGALDTLDAFGLSYTIKGVPQSNLPTYLTQYQNNGLINTGKMKTPDLDKIRAQHPDLIIINGRQMSFYKELSSIAPTLNYSIDGKNYLSSVKEKITLLGQITGRESVAKTALNQLDQKIMTSQNIADTSTKNAIIALHNDGKLMLLNQGAHAALIYDTLHVKRNDPVSSPLPLIKSAQNPADKPTPPPRIMVTNDYIAAKKPDIIYIIDRSKAIGSTPMNSSYFDAKVLEKTGTQVVLLSADLWYLSGGGVESINKQIDEVIAPLK